jgi:hypothetical protein
VIEVLKGFPDNVVAFAFHERVTKADYETMLIPEIEKALEQHEKVQIYYEFAPDFVGVDLGAAWEDARLGITHFLQWGRIAVVADVEWIKQTMRFFGFLTPTKMRTFPTAEVDQARDWIAQAQD